MTKYLNIAEHYNKCYEKYGDNHKGMDWPNKVDTHKRFKVMLDVMNHQQNEYFNERTVLDFGCGTGHMIDYFNLGSWNMKYSGLDINKSMIEKAVEKNPDTDFYCIDILSQTTEFHLLPKFDYILCNGTFTVKTDLTYKEMHTFMKAVLEKLLEKCNYGIAFNTMSKILDYERDDLFHISFDELGSMIYSDLRCSNFVFRQDYGLREFTTYIYKN